MSIFSSCEKFVAQASLGAEVMFPGHGPPIIGAAKIRQAFTEVAEFLDAIIGQCLEAINGSDLSLYEMDEYFIKNDGFCI